MKVGEVQAARVSAERSPSAEHFIGLLSIEVDHDNDGRVIMRMRHGARVQYAVRMTADSADELATLLRST